MSKGMNMKTYTAHCCYAADWCQTVSVEADTIEDACEAAIEQANGCADWRSGEGCGDTFVSHLVEGDENELWRMDGPTVPFAWTEAGAWNREAVEVCRELASLAGSIPPDAMGAIGLGRIVDKARAFLTSIGEEPAVLLTDEVPAPAAESMGCEWLTDAQRVQLVDWVGEMCERDDLEYPLFLARDQAARDLFEDDEGHGAFVTLHAFVKYPAEWFAQLSADDPRTWTAAPD